MVTCNQLQQRHDCTGIPLTHVATAAPVPQWGPWLFPAQGLAKNSVEFIPSPAEWERHFFPVLLLTSTSLHPLPSVAETHLMGPWAKVVAASPAPLQPPLCPGNLGPSEGQGQPLPSFTPAQHQEAARRKEGRSALVLPNLSITKNGWLSVLVPRSVGRSQTFLLKALLQKS